jgi:hypothetical protein
MPTVVEPRRRQLLGFALDVQRRQAGSRCMVLQGHWCTEHRHEAVTGELVDRPAEALYHRSRPVDQRGHDLAQALRAHRRRDVHGVHNIGEQHRHLLELGGPVGRIHG